MNSKAFILRRCCISPQAREHKWRNDDLLDERELVADTCVGTSAESELMSPHSWNMVCSFGDRIPSLWSAEIMLDKLALGRRDDTGLLELQSIISPSCFVPVDRDYGEMYKITFVDPNI